jgi:PAS domain S-box-containing protein
MVVMVVLAGAAAFLIELLLMKALFWIGAEGDRSSHLMLDALGAGFASALLVAVCVLALGRTNARAREIAQQMTSELRASKETSERLTRDYEVLSRALDQYAIVSVADPSGKITYANDRFTAISGYSREELIGRTHNILSSGEHPKAMWVEMWKTVASGRPWMGEVCNRSKHGSLYWVDTAILPSFGADGNIEKYVSIRIDVTMRKQLEESLEHERERLRAFIKQTPAAVAMFDNQMRYLAVSDRWIEDYRLRGQTVIGRTHYEVFPAVPQRWKEIHSRCLAGAVESRANDPWRPTGWDHDQHLRWEVRPWRHTGGAIGGIVMYTQDITSEVLAMKALGEARARADEASRAKGQFLANMSHEIRTPMTAILGFTDVLAEDGDWSKAPERRKQTIATIRRNGEHLLAVINDILDVSKIDAGKMTVEAVATNPAQIVEAVVSQSRPSALEKGIGLDLVYDTDVPREFSCDPVRLRQILINLVGNAIKFTEAGGVAVRVAFEPDETARLRFAVTDTGIGIPTEHAARLFQPFHQADTTMTRRFGGTGLGLTISQRLAELLGGTISVQSRVGYGSTFVATVAVPNAASVVMWRPNAQGVAASPIGNTTAAPPVIRTGLEGVRVLLAEDGPDNQRLIGYHLSKAGALPTVVSDGVEAVRALTCEDESHTMQWARDRFDLVLMDMQMPEMDGYTATRTLRSLGCRVPIIALTAHAMVGDSAKCYAAGCDGYATKPIDREALLEICRQWIGRESEAGAGKIERHAA